MKVFISIVSHGHCELVRKLNLFGEINENFTLVIKSNKPGDEFNDLASKPNAYWINDRFGLGFGENNNVIYEFCKANLGMGKDDYFFVVNPDVFITSFMLKQLLERIIEHDAKLSAINLFKDQNFTVFDNSIRKFPRLFDFVCSYVGLGNKTIIDKSQLTDVTTVDWSAGSFLAFKASHYELLKGFNEKYFMYCEDIDICYRSSKAGHSVVYFPDIKAIHLAQHSNRKLFSRHFYWHLKSVVRFLLSK